jgi:hypothetical protein
MAETAAMHNESAAPRRAGWLSELIQQARARGVDNGDIAAALEGSIVFRPLTIGRDGHDRLVSTMMHDHLTMTDLFDLLDEDHPTR